MPYRSLLITFLVGFAAALPLLAIAGGSEFDGDLKHVTKFAAGPDDQPHVKLKSLCVCLDANADFDGVLGGIYWDTDTLPDNLERLEVHCMGYLHDQSDGRRRAWKRCDDWRPLTK